MTAYPTWTPASRPGIVPLRPLTFGMILGRSFTALRQNPRVLLGFALGVQVVAYLLLILGTVAVAFLTFSRLDTVRENSDEFNAIMAGSVLITAITVFVLSIATGALTVVVQAVVVSEVAHEVVSEKLTLGALWQRVKPVIWRLIGYSLLLSAAALVLIAIVGGTIFAIGVAALPAAIVLTVLAFLAAIPLTLWLVTKLLLVPAVIILEHATIGQAIARGWTLVRGRFWAALGVVVIVYLVFYGLTQVVSIPFSFLSGGLTTVISPTGDPEPAAIITLVVTLVIVQVVTLLIQSVWLVVQSTSTTLIYVDCRMRHEGLDLDLLSYVERRDAGATGLPDPYRENIGRAIAPRPPAYTGPAYAPQGYAPQGYAPQGYAPQAYPPAQGYPQGAGYPQGQGYPQPGSVPQAHAAPAPVPPPLPPTPPVGAAPAPQQPDAQRWAAPGAASAPADPDSPWTSP